MADAPAPDAKAWMIKAWRDLETARRAATGEPPFYDVAVYHCQQAAEKAVKTFLVQHGKPYEKTHDIEVLIDLAGEVEASFSKLADDADALTPYATRFRYPNATFAVEPQPAEYAEAEQHAQAVYDFVLNLLPKGA
ncbi:MAG: HEPN domain-containing protein [Verrucomicrobia bacterium]|nr:HEPN domain-containing protein [Verrucomicrobiota bacterium]